MITDKYLEEEHEHNFLNSNGVRRVYAMPNGYKLSAINNPMLHSYKFAWEFAVINALNEIDYDTPLTGDVYVTHTDEEANAFIEKAYNVLANLTEKK
jgi:hypothetical protein